MEDRKLARKELLQKHSTWTYPSLDFVLGAKNLEDRVRREVLLGNSCSKCSIEMGEHKWYGEKFICPTLKEGLYSTSYGNTARYEGGETAFDIDAGENIPIEMLGDFIRKEE